MNMNIDFIKLANFWKKIVFIFSLIVGTGLMCLIVCSILAAISYLILGNEIIVLQVWGVTCCMMWFILGVAALAVWLDELL